MSHNLPILRPRELHLLGDAAKLAYKYRYIDTVDKFGFNPAVGVSEEDIWSYGGEETLLTSGATMYASCTDNTNGVGQVLLVAGLDENWKEQTGYVTLTGYTQAAVVSATGGAQLWTRIHRAYQISAGADPVGDVYIAELDGSIALGVPSSAALVHGFIDFTNAAQQTQKALYTVPANHCMFLYGSQAYMDAPTTGAARYVTIAIEVSELGTGATVSNPSWTPRRRVEEYTVSTATTSWEHMFQWPLVFGPLTNVHMRAVASATSAVLGSFEFVLCPTVDHVDQD